MSKPPITYGRLGKKRAQIQAHLRAHSTDSDSDPIDSLSSPTRPTLQRTEVASKSGDSPRGGQRPSKILRNERPNPSTHKESHSSPSLPSSSSVQQPTGRSPSSSAQSLARGSKRKHTDPSPNSDNGKVTTASRSSKRRKVEPTSDQHTCSDTTELCSPSPPPIKPPSTRSNAPTSKAAAEKAPCGAFGTPSSAAPSQNLSIFHGAEGDTHTPAPVSLTRTPSGSRSAKSKLPRDLSQIFFSHGSNQSNSQTMRSSPSPSRSSLSTSSTPRKTKMLSRSATFPSREAAASMDRGVSADASPILPSTPRSRTSVVQKTASWPMVSPSPSKSDAPPLTGLQRAGDAKNDTILDALVPRPTLRTYSASRSFLATVPLSPTTSRDDCETQDAIQHESYADLRKKYRVDLSSDDDLETGISGPVDLKTIGELRDKGENRRFLDDMGYLLEGLAPKMSIAVKRLSAVKLIDNMGDLEYARRAKACDAVGIAWDALEAASEGDKVLDAAVASFAALVTRDPRLAEEFARQPSAAIHLSRLLSLVPSSDPFGFNSTSDRLDEGRRLGLGKPERTMIAQLHGVLSNAEIFGDDYWFTSRRLCTQSLLAMHIHSKATIPPLLESLLHETDLLLERLRSYNIGLPIIPDPSYDTPDIQHISNIVQILESSLLVTPETTAVRSISPEERRHISTNLMTASVICTALDHQSSIPNLKASACLTNILRLLVKLADSTPDWAIEVAHTPHSASRLIRVAAVYHANRPLSDHDILSADKELDANRLDIKCLALALLTSVLLEETATRSSVFQSSSPTFPSSYIPWVDALSTELSPNCSFGRSCTADCQCRGRIRAAGALVGLYLDESKRSRDMSNPEAAFLKGHLAILLGLACEGAETANIFSLLKDLPGLNDRAKLDAWIDTIRDFMGLYSDLARGFERALKLARQNDAAQDPEDSDDEDTPGLSDERNGPRSANPTAPLFSLAEAKGGEKGIEIAERVIGVLAKFRE